MTLDAKGAGFRSLGDPIDTTSPQGRFTLQILGAVAEFERRDQPLRILRRVPLRAMLAAVAVHVHRNQLMRDPLEIERDAHAVGGGAAEIGIKLHCFLRWECALW